MPHRKPACIALADRAVKYLCAYAVLLVGLMYFYRKVFKHEIFQS